MTTLKKDSSNSPALVSAYRGKAMVFLEGETDLNLFRNYWFKNRRDKIEFKEPQAGIGCNGVIAEVSAGRRETGLPAFGIVDRDKLHADRQWPLVWETDDAAFLRARPYGDHIRVTRYWEIESYLIDPEAVEEHVAHCDRGRLPRDKETVEKECLAHAEALIPQAALNSALRAGGQQEWKDRPAFKAPGRESVEAHLAEHRTKGEIAEPVWNEYQRNLQKVARFSQGVTSSERLEGLLRRVDGKTLINRIKRASGLQHDVTFHLAAAIARMNAIPKELVGYIDEFSQA